MLNLPNGVKSLHLFPMQLHLFEEFPLNKWQYFEIQQKKMDHITGLMFFTLNMEKKATVTHCYIQHGSLL